MKEILRQSFAFWTWNAREWSALVSYVFGFAAGIAVCAMVLH